MTPVRPYPPDTQWAYESRRRDHERTTPLVLGWEVNTSSMSDDYLPDEMPARELWRRWLTYVDEHDAWHRSLGRPWVRIGWYVTAGDDGGVFEFAPHEFEPLSGDSFETFFTTPHNDEHGDINWLRLPVRDGEWNATRADKGGFIQEATGWKPSPLQPAVNIEQITAAARL
jgi:hypothetical protein